MKKFAEFFAGIGLVRAGLASTGWHCAYANDIEPKKHQMYVDHFGPSPEYHVGDVWDAATVLSRLPRDLTLATASFPCTDLSLAGHWRGIDGKHSSTFFAFIEVLRQLKADRPPLLLIENVLGFVKSNRGADFARACQELSRNGYWLDAVLLDAKWFVPQSRPRIFLIGVQDGLRRHPIFSSSESLFDLDHPSESDQLRPAQLRQAVAKSSLETGWLTARLPPLPRRRLELRDILEAGNDQDWWDKDDVDRHLEPMQLPSLRRIQQLKNASAYTIGTAFRRTRLGKPRAEVRFDVAGCLRTPRGGSARQIVIRVGCGEVGMRWMTPIEYARLQGIPEFNLRVPVQQALFGFGDAVCVPAIQWLDQHLLTPLAAEPVAESVQASHGHVLAG